MASGKSSMPTTSSGTVASASQRSPEGTGPPAAGTSTISVSVSPAASEPPATARSSELVASRGVDAGSRPAKLMLAWAMPSVASCETR